MQATTGIGRRIAGAAQAAWDAARQKWNAPALVPTEYASWTSYEARLFRYAHFAAYYDNTVYTSLVGYAKAHRESAQLYRNIRGVYNPVARLTDLYVDKIYGGAIDYDNMSQGSIPILDASDDVLTAIKQLWQWSNWGVKKSHYVRTGAKLGDVALKVIDDRARMKVRLEVLHPGKVKEVELDDVGNVKKIVIEYLMSRPDIDEGKVFIYTETIDQSSFRTMKDGEPYGFYEDASGAKVASWPNEYGFVPIVLAQHRDVGAAWGTTSFNASLRKIDELNDAASLLNDHVRKAVRMVWWAAGVAKKSELSAETDDRDKLPMVYAPADSKPVPMVFPLDIGAALENIRELQYELERDMPELTLHRLRSGGSDMTAPGVRAAYSDAIDKINEARSNYDDALVRAHQMAISIGALSRYEGFTPFSINSYAEGALVHHITDRAVIEDDLTVQQRIGYLMKSGAPPWAIWEELDVPKDKIEAWKAEAVTAPSSQSIPGAAGEPDMIRDDVTI